MQRCEVQSPIWVILILSQEHACTLAPHFPEQSKGLQHAQPNSKMARLRRSSLPWERKGSGGSPGRPTGRLLWAQAQLWEQQRERRRAANGVTQQLHRQPTILHTPVMPPPYCSRRRSCRPAAGRLPSWSGLLKMPRACSTS